MELKVGQSYTTKGGWKATVMYMDDEGTFDVMHHKEDGNIPMWHCPHDEGCSNISPFPDTYDLVAELKE